MKKQIKSLHSNNSHLLPNIKPLEISDPDLFTFDFKNINLSLNNSSSSSTANFDGNNNIDSTLNNSTPIKLNVLKKSN